MRVSLTGVVQVVAPLEYHLIDSEAALQVVVEEDRHWFRGCSIRVLIGQKQSHDVHFIKQKQKIK